MSEPIREQLAKMLWGWGEERTDFSDGSWLTTRDAEKLADAILERFPALSPVGEAEAAKLPLDPEPWRDVCHNYGEMAACSGTRAQYDNDWLRHDWEFSPGDGYSKERGDYR